MLARMCIASLLLLATGCANLASINHMFTEGPYDRRTRLISVDAQQRFMQMRRVTEDAKGRSEINWRLCAEPSPDAIQAISASAAGNLAAARATPEGSTQEAAAAFAASIASQVAAFGLRTQSITLLRDAAFRLCEGYLNGAFDHRQFQTLHRRLQNIMVATLAIEQLTGYARPTVAAIGGAAFANAGGNILAAQRALDQAQQHLIDNEAKLKDAQKNLEVAQAADKASVDPKDAIEKSNAADAQAGKDAKALKAAKDEADKVNKDPKSTDADKKKVNDAVAAAEANAKKSEEAKKTANKLRDDLVAKKTETTDALVKATASLKAAQNAITDGKANVQALTDARDQARTTGASATSLPAQINAPPAPASATQAVAEAIKAIVDGVISRDYTKDTCLDFLAGEQAALPAYKETKKMCLEYFQVVIQTIQAEAGLPVTVAQSAEKPLSPGAEGEPKVTPERPKTAAPAGQTSRETVDRALRRWNYSR